jgi:Uma2 family endonuclease
MRAAEVFALKSDTTRVDRWLFDGELVERWDGTGFHTPAHAAMVANISCLLRNWYRTTNDFRMFGYGCPYVLARDPDTLVTFDVSVVRRNICDKPRWDDTHIEGVPSLAVEVVELDEDPDLLSRLVENSLRHGVELMWVIDPHEMFVTVHRRFAKPQCVNGQMSLTTSDDLLGFSCSIAEIFE